MDKSDEHEKCVYKLTAMLRALDAASTGMIPATVYIREVLQNTDCDARYPNLIDIRNSMYTSLPYSTYSNIRAYDERWNDKDRAKEYVFVRGPEERRLLRANLTFLDRIVYRIWKW